MWSFGIVVCFGLNLIQSNGVNGQICQGETCSECISFSKDCRWCMQPNFHDTASLRCNKLENLLDAGCSEENIISPNSSIEYIKNEVVTDGDSSGQNAVQLSPQLVHIKSTPNTPVKIPITFRAARNFPVDLYFLFDASYTMKDHKNKLATLSQEMASKIQSISRNYRFGFGCFQDKVILPFTDTKTSYFTSICRFKIGAPCSVCVPPFGYLHRLSLTNNIGDFYVTIQDSPLSGNIDTPEGGLDAIMQAVACENEIGWREQARRLIIYASDNTFHFAGDGRLAGIVLPNDGKCHLVNGTNTEDIRQDYPSIGQISQKVSEKNVNLIFAIVKSVEEDYQQLSKNILDSYVGVLEGDSSNVVDIVRTTYEAIISEVKFKIDAPNNTVVKIFSNCNSEKMKETTECKGLSIGKEIKLEVQVYSTKCPEKPDDRNRTINITAIGLSDQFTIQLESDCDCVCGFSEPSSPRCSTYGTFECGICNCDVGREGDRCQCSEIDVIEGRNVDPCVSNKTTVKCMGRGECKCGLCSCELGYTGRYCECDTNACEKLDGQICGGAERGRCVCETCVCNEEYTGSKCDCPTSTDACLAQDGTICNGKGTCKCGKCICDALYIGSTCQNCPTCPGACEDNRDCVECIVFNEGELTQDECIEQCPVVEIVESIEDLNETCQAKDIDGCKMIYKIVYLDDGNTTILAQKYKVCSTQIDMVPIIAGVLGGIVGLGIFLLALWKILTSVYDNREYAKFQQEVDQVRWAQESNPIYKGATSTYKNPMCNDFDAM
ncbi:hypothetical protein LOTGIDRAFT_196574 [Lottia gigantea]|uniref:Integrin beta n=1 Tax=Lottia gigantea TaxID=225164 RepID=V3Z1U4_LOTGI|nr:hypothetical protein LOTGIDRAFT_196574 [Lottia gigantea]ESO84518.1 hypothetical protein LOTGIDRAFT_196574 [Lottia gigantea]